MDAAQKEFRLKGIGASEIAAVCGVSPFMTPLDVYAAKVHPNPKDEESEPMYWGHAIEPAIIARFAHEHPLVKVQAPVQPQMLGNEPILATPDGLVIEGSATTSGLEVKNVGLSRRAEWGETGDDIPIYYQTQVQYGMLVFSLPVWWVSVLIGGQEYREFPVKADPDIQNSLREAANRFWVDHVLAKNPPEPTARDVDTMKRIYPVSTDRFIRTDGNAELENIIRAMVSARRKAKQIEEERDQLEASVKAALGDAAGLEGAWGRITWKSGKPMKGLDLAGLRERFPKEVAAFEYVKPSPRRFLVKAVGGDTEE